MPQDTGIILKTYPLGETGLIVVWSTADHGIIRTAARTALKPGGDFFGRLDLFFEAELLWETSKTGDLDHLKSVSLLNPRLALRHSFPKLRLAGYMTKLLLATVEPRTPIPEIHLMLHRALDYLGTRTATRHIMQHFEKDSRKSMACTARACPPSPSCAAITHMCPPTATHCTTPSPGLTGLLLHSVRQGSSLGNRTPGMTSHPNLVRFSLKD